MKTENLDRFYKIHSKFYDLTRKFFLLNREKALSMLDLRPGENVIDFACGTGLNVPFLIQKNVNVTGIDYSAYMLEKAREKYPFVNFVEGDVSGIKIKEKADAIVCTYSISMIEKWTESVLNMKNSLKKEGRLLILDFYPFQGYIKFLYPAFKKWLMLHGVDPEKPVIPFLNQHFKKLDYWILNSGYNFIALAQSPKG